MDKTSKVPLMLEFLFNDRFLALGTGFVYMCENEFFLITTWHNVTGRFSPTRKILREDDCAIPNAMRFYFPVHLDLPPKKREEAPDGAYTTLWSESRVPLYKDEECLVPWWYEHPVHREKVDLVALPVGISLTNVLPANDSSLGLEKDMPLLPSLDVYIIGFPMGLSGGSKLPVWKRGSIATEPYNDIDGLPKLFIDTATRKGMSGAPVYAEVTTTPNFQRKTNAAKVGKVRKFLGIYSGRVGTDESQAQLGTVWKEKAIEEVIKGQKVGTSSFS